MTTNNPSSGFQHVLSFPQGHFLVYNNGAYFIPRQQNAAYHLLGDVKNLHGKIALEARSSNQNIGKYSLTWEIEDGQLISARLIGGAQTYNDTQKYKGTLLDPQATKEIFAKLDNGTIPLLHKEHPPRISIAMQTQDGRQAVVIYDKNYELWFGPKGNLQKIETDQWAMSMGMKPYHSIKTKNGDRFKLFAPDHKTRNEKVPSYNDEPLMLIPLQDHADAAAFGLKTRKPVVMLDPFSQECIMPAAPFAQSAKKSAPKP